MSYIKISLGFVETGMDSIQTNTTQVLPGAPVFIETIEERLTPVVSVDSQSYGPLPPSTSGK